MVFRKFFKNVKNSFNKLKNLDKKIRDERKELFEILTKLQNNLQKTKIWVIIYHKYFVISKK